MSGKFLKIRIGLFFDDFPFNQGHRKISSTVVLDIGADHIVAGEGQGLLVDGITMDGNPCFFFAAETISCKLTRALSGVGPQTPVEQQRLGSNISTFIIVFRWNVGVNSSQTPA